MNRNVAWKDLTPANVTPANDHLFLSRPVISGGNFLTVTDVKINGQTAAIYNKSSNTSITVVGINATAVNTVEEGTVTLNAQPAISSVVAEVPSIWSTVSGSGFKFGVSSVRVNGVSAGWQLNTDGAACW